MKRKGRPGGQPFRYLTGNDLLKSKSGNRFGAMRHMIIGPL